MKKRIAIGGMALLMTLAAAICAPAYGDVYMEYSEAMVDALQDKVNRRFTENVLAGESVVLYGVRAEGGGGRTTRNLGERAFPALMECFSSSPVGDTCKENNRLQRIPELPIDIRVLDTTALTPSSNTAILFASYRGAVSELKGFIEEKSRPVHLLYFGDGPGNPLFYLSFGPVKNPERLAGMYPFHRAKTKSRCSARCGWIDEKRGIKDRRIDFLHNCFSGRLPGIPGKVTYRYPDRALLTNRYIDCPAGTFPPRPRLNRNLERLDLGMSESDYYRALRACRTQPGYTDDDSSRSSRIGIKIAVDITLSPVKRAVYDKLPLPIRKMFAELSGESVESYPLPVKYTVLGQFEGCE
uniref:Uncharacterized protein n=1 Tax=Candidatus Kentrum sp. FM TaxID=2126340 RepID=A0A450RY62_9GAMM|nr:MAG: hypothetical protein BECKFM1743C_GA0114222_100088 [Candidatus Kentron sp. FM]VFJ46363.1 MAG: hypothetical protein BECKFM1743A_GA0114220_100364 [Candidatus Kentron sp. FM]VFK07499.1 MAG: hypothetical protein BECKFM1743B_GA0114221_100422 [Candidatus Kentron sp. FM]